MLIHQLTWVINSKLMLEAKTREPKIPQAHPKLNCGYSSFCGFRKGESVRLGKEYRVNSKPLETTVILTWLSWWWNTPKSSRQPHEHRENGGFVPKARLQCDRLWYSLQGEKQWEKTNVNSVLHPPSSPSITVSARTSSRAWTTMNHTAVLGAFPVHSQQS